MSQVPDGERLARAALARVLEPGRQDVHAAVQRFGAVAVWDAVRTDRLDRLGTHPRWRGDARWRGAVERAAGYSPGRDLEALDRVGARLVCPGDDEWPAERLTWEPELLDDAPPLALHVRGHRSLREVVQRSCAVVGARAATSYGTVVAQDLALGLAERSCTVISGAAYGIDKAAHDGALAAAAAPTVAVLACGLDRVYPSGHEGLLVRIAATGLVVSELPVGSAPHRNRFLVRNRLIAALSLGTVAVEAAWRSGSLATVQRARSLHRHVMAVPGPVTSALSAGTNELLRAGATCVTNAAEVLAVIGELGHDLDPEPSVEHRVRDDLPAAVRRVLDAVPVRRGAGVASIARTAGVSALAVQQMLPPLVLHGLVEQVPDGFRLTALGAGRQPRAG